MKHPPATPFFLPGAAGGRFCLYHAPATSGAARGAFVYIHPFAEEMNCARRMAAEQSRRLAACGFGVLQIDLTGCGDSCGELRDVRWQMWQQDVVDAARWLAQNCSPAVSLWGLRAGALLAMDTLAQLDAVPPHLLLWQPVTNGERFLTQFLRIALARRMGSADSAGHSKTSAMRAALAAGDVLEIAGYELSGVLAGDLQAVQVPDAIAPASRVHWIETAPQGEALPAASARLHAAWRAGGAAVDTELIDTTPFWSVPGHDLSAPLIDATLRMLAQEAS